MFGSYLCHNKGDFGLRCQTKLKRSHVMFPALQVSSQRWFWLVAGATNLSLGVRLMGLFFFFCGTPETRSAQHILGHRGWLLGGTGGVWYCLNVHVPLLGVVRLLLWLKASPGL